jgi:hypothetical protein
MNDQERIVADMWMSGASAQEIGGYVGLSGSAIYQWRKRLGLPARPKMARDLKPDPTPDEIETRARECREKHFAKRRLENENDTRKRVWKEDQCDRLRTQSL